MATKFRFKNADGTTVDFEDYYVRSDYFRSGNLWVWGDNTFGALGDNTSTKRSSPVQTVAWGSNWIEFGYGNYSSTAIKTDGTLWCSGLGSSGELGDNTISTKSSPVQTVTFGTNWKSSVYSQGSASAIKTDGTLWCWGVGTSGQLGDNTAISRSSPVQTVAFGTNWKQSSSLNAGIVALKTDGTLWCWGDNGSGNLGDNTIVAKSSPVQTVAFGTNWMKLSSPNSSSNGGFAAIKTDGTLWIWGSNSYGKLGDNTTTSRSSPVQTVAFATNWKQVSSGNSHTAAIKTDGTLWIWGRNNSGQLGDNTIVDKSSPIQTVTFGNNWKQVACGNACTAAIKTDGTLWMWGLNTSGQLGDNTTTNKSSPVQTVMFGTNWKKVFLDSIGRTAAIQYQDDYQ